MDGSETGRYEMAKLKYTKRKDNTASFISLLKPADDDGLIGAVENLLDMLIERGVISRDQANEWVGTMDEGKNAKIKAQKSIRRKAVPMGKGYVISVALKSSGLYQHISGLYRHIRVPASMLLSDFAAAILDAYDFDEDHMSAFFMDNRPWSDVDSYYSGEMDDDSRVMGNTRLADVGLTKGKKFLYIFDFGDEWTFHCRVLREVDDAKDDAEIVRSVGKAPDQYPNYDAMYDEE